MYDRVDFYPYFQLHATVGRMKNVKTANAFVLKDTTGMNLENVSGQRAVRSQFWSQEKWFKPGPAC